MWLRSSAWPRAQPPHSIALCSVQSASGIIMGKKAARRRKAEENRRNAFETRNNGDVDTEIATSRNSALEFCSHVSSCMPKKVESSLKRNPLLKCSTCKCSEDDMWVCLVCGHVGCGRGKPGQHALAHSKQKKHFVACVRNLSRAWCYSCNQETAMPALNRKTRNKLEKKLTECACIIKRFCNQKLPCSQQTNVVEVVSTLNSGITEERHVNGVISSELSRFNLEQIEDIDCLHNFAKEDTVFRPCGIRNIGNTCFFASTLQCISECRPLHKHLFDLSEHGSTTLSGPLHNQLKIFLAHFCSGKARTINPAALLNQLSKIQPMFSGRRQHDAHELLRRFLDSLREEHLDAVIAYRKTMWRDWEVNTIRAWMDSIGLPHRNIDDGHISTLLLDKHSQAELAKLYSSSEKRLLEVEIIKVIRGHSPFSIDMAKRNNVVPSLVDNVFGGMLQSQIQCLDCKKVYCVIHQRILCSHCSSFQISLTREPYNDLSVSLIPPTKSCKRKVNTIFPKNSTKRTLSPPIVNVNIELCNQNINMDEGWFDEIRVNLTVSSEQDAFRNESNGPTQQILLNQLLEDSRQALEPLNNQCDLVDCLRAFFSPEILFGENAYECANCGKEMMDTAKRVAAKRYRIVEQPPILVCHLKRFIQEGRRFRKLEKNVSFPLHLDLSEFCSDSRGDINGQSRNHVSQSHAYCLFGVVVHIGGMGGGHYISYTRKDRQEGDPSKGWYYFSDSSHRPCSIDEVLSAQGYLLLYERKQ